MASKNTKKNFDELRDRLIRSTLEYGQENGSCESGMIDFIGDIFPDMSRDEISAYIGNIETESLESFEIRIKCLGIEVPSAGFIIPEEQVERVVDFINKCTLSYYSHEDFRVLGFDIDILEG